MSLKSIDQSIEKYLKELYPNVVFSSNSKAYEYGVDSNTLELKLPLISVDRISTTISTSNYNFASNRRGSLSSRSNTFYGDRDLPVELSYQISIWSDDRYECDDLWREVAMYIMCNPSLIVEYESTKNDDGSNVTKLYTMHIDGNDIDFDDTSFEDLGRLYRMILTITIPEARLLYERKVDLVQSIPVKTVIVNKTPTKSNLEELDKDINDIDLVIVDK